MLLAGVGGQGILLASDIISRVIMKSGLDVKKSEVHGMAQRGGCVTSHVRFGKKVYSPLAKMGAVDILVSFEKLETLRYLNYLKPGGIVIMSEEEIYPPSVNLGEIPYPSAVEEIVRQQFETVAVLNAPELAVKAGNIKAANTVMLGAISVHIAGIELTTWEIVLGESLPDKVLKANLRAFELGRKHVANRLH